MTNEKPTLEESFRSSLEDVVAIATRLSAHCKSVPDLVEVSKLALESDSQLRLLMTLVAQGKK